MAQSLKKQNPTLTLYGVGGPNLNNKVDTFIENTATKSASGTLESFKNRSYFRDFLSRLDSFLSQTKIDRVIIVDYQHQNFKIAALIQSFNIPIITYITPNFWIWKDLKSIKKLVDYSHHIICIYEKEYALYSTFSQNVSYFGHPFTPMITDEIPTPPALKEPYNIALCPGSRVHEIEHHLPVMLKSVNLLKQHKDHTFIFKLVVSSDEFLPLIKTLLEKYNCSDITLIQEDKDSTFKTAHIILNIPGTTTLTTMLYHVPQVVIGITSWLTYIIIKYILRLAFPLYSLPNIIAGKAIVPELIQRKATPKAIVKNIIDQLSRANRKWLDHQYVLTKKKLIKDQEPFDKAATLILNKT